MANGPPLHARRRRGMGTRTASVLTTVAVLTAAQALPAVAATPAAPMSPPLTALAAPSVPTPSPLPAAVAAAMQRDLHLDADQVRARRAREAVAPGVEQSLRTTLGEGFGGAWLSDDGTLNIGVTTSRAKPAVRAAGAIPRTVEYSEGELDAAKTELDRHAKATPRSVFGWHVDLPTNRVVITVEVGQTPAGRAFSAKAGVRDEMVQVVTSTQRPQLMADLRGGEAFRNADVFIDGKGCSVGFAVSGGFVTAGHCKGSSASVYTLDGWWEMGRWADWSFPTNDYAWVRTHGPGVVPLCLI
ncbi:alpha-lytic protease prodomain-containing protein [Micromonospora sp. LOL_023]|uniref:alpha-lytic protease prodomain-containing protein n=1 Tax=Micromonospora sp. LOL_023 TaxID=3345418 RepID=UPI003A89F5B6